MDILELEGCLYSSKNEIDSITINKLLLETLFNKT